MTEVLRVLVDGVPGDQVSVQDRALQYGHGLFETMKLHQGQVRLWPLHLARLQAGAVRLQIPLDPVRLSQWLQLLIADQQQGTIKLLLSRGDSARGYAVPATSQARCVLSLLPPVADSCPAQGVRVKLCQTRLAQQPLLAGMKHLNRLEQVLARAEWQPPQHQEGLVLDTSERLVEGTFSNLYLVQRGLVRTPDLSRCGVAGVMRQYLLETLLPAQHIPVEICDLSLEDLAQADGCFLSNSLIGVWPVAAVDLPQGTLQLPGVTMGLALRAALDPELGFSITP